ncbi:MAG: regulatory protein RecX [Candidatus Omnitrophota bacterium]
MINKGDPFQKAKDYAFLLLKFRLRSERELIQRLKIKKFDETVIRSVVEFLKDKRFIDDALFAKNWVKSRIEKPLGLSRIRRELLIKGIAKEIIDQELENIKKRYSEEEIILSIAKERLRRLSSIDPQKARKRIYAYLLRRGFSMDLVCDTINQLCKRKF